MAVLFQRPRGLDTTKGRGVKELFPNAFAKRSRRLPSAGSTGNPNGIETLGVSCAHCGYPVPDTSKVKTCPECNSDNTRGEVLPG